MRIYEGMFLLEDNRANDNWDAVSGEVRGLLEKHQAEILTFERWDDRRLAYPIKGRNRAVYLLARFTAPTEALAPLERDCLLNENVLRVLFTRDTASEKLHKLGLFPPKPEEPATPAEQPPAGDTEAPAPTAETPAAAADASAPTAETPAPAADAPAPTADAPAADAKPQAPSADAAPADTPPETTPQNGDTPATQ